jgi:hypothetical protein
MASKLRLEAHNNKKTVNRIVLPSNGPHSEIECIEITYMRGGCIFQFLPDERT